MPPFDTILFSEKLLNGKQIAWRSDKLKRVYSQSVIEWNWGKKIMISVARFAIEWCELSSFPFSVKINPYSENGGWHLSGFLLLHTIPAKNSRNDLMLPLHLLDATFTISTISLTSLLSVLRNIWLHLTRWTLFALHFLLQKTHRCSFRIEVSSDLCTIGHNWNIYS